MATLNITSVKQLEYLWKVLVDIEAESRTTCLPRCPGYPSSPMCPGYPSSPMCPGYPSSPMCPAAIVTTDVYRATLQ